jgi:hypothetical protein
MVEVRKKIISYSVRLNFSNFKNYFHIYFFRDKLVLSQQSSLDTANRKRCHGGAGAVSSDFLQSWEHSRRRGFEVGGERSTGEKAGICRQVELRSQGGRKGGRFLCPSRTLRGF